VVSSFWSSKLSFHKGVVFFPAHLHSFPFLFRSMLMMMMMMMVLTSPTRPFSFQFLSTTRKNSVLHDCMIISCPYNLLFSSNHPDVVVEFSNHEENPQREHQQIMIKWEMEMMSICLLGFWFGIFVCFR